MKIKIVSFGHKKDELQPQLDDYVRRITKPWALEFIDHASARQSEKESAEEVMAREAKKITGEYWTLSVLGTQPTSEEFARWLEQHTRDLTLVIGGADGLHASVEKNARRRVSLSKLTLPHRLARVVLVEQIYRAQCILRGTKYHR